MLRLSITVIVGKHMLCLDFDQLELHRFSIPHVNLVFLVHVWCELIDGDQINGDFHFPMYCSNVVDTRRRNIPGWDAPPRTCGIRSLTRCTRRSPRRYRSEEPYTVR